MEMNLAKRKAQYKEAQKIIVDDCPVAFLYEVSFHEGYLAKVQQPPRGVWGLTDALVETSVRS